MSALIRSGCTECGWSGSPRGYRTQAQADYAYRRHSCDRVRRARASYERGLAREAAVDRTPKVCQHPKVDHQHGTYACYVLDACRCLPCAAARSAYDAARDRGLAYGTWEPYVDVAPAVDHLRRLSAAGLGRKRVAAAAGVPETSVCHLLYGRNGKPRTRARRRLVEAILAVPMPTLDDLGATVVVDGTGTRRRLQALVSCGWSVQKIADRMPAGVDRQRLDSALSGRPVRAETARAVRAVYDELWDQAPPEITKGDRIAAAKTRSRARAMSWAPPLAWDDETIDDPDALPAHLAVADVDELDDVDEAAIARALAGEPVTLTRAERRLILAQLVDAGMTDRAIAERVGVTDRTVLRERQRLGLESRRAA